MRWFRFYDDVLNSPKVQRLKPELFQAWVNFLCIASKNDGEITGNMEALAFTLRLPIAKVRAQLLALQEVRLIDVTETGFTPHDWSEHQYDSDTSTERVRRHRERKRNADGNVTTDQNGVAGNAVEQSRAETESDTEQNREEKKEREEKEGGAHATRDAPRATRLALDALPDDWRAYCVENHPGLNPEAMWHEFHDYWKSRGGEKARKADWPATWRTWLRRAEEFKNGGRQKSDRPSRGQLMAAEALALGERLDRDAELHQRPGLPARRTGAT